MVDPLREGGAVGPPDLQKGHRFGVAHRSGREEPLALGIHVRLLLERDLGQASDRLVIRISEVAAAPRLLVRDVDPGLLQLVEARQTSLNGGAVLPGGSHLRFDRILDPLVGACRAGEPIRRFVGREIRVDVAKRGDEGRG